MPAKMVKSSRRRSVYKRKFRRYYNARYPKPTFTPRIYDGVYFDRVTRVTDVFVSNGSGDVQFIVSWNERVPQVPPNTVYFHDNQLDFAPME